MSPPASWSPCADPRCSLTGPLHDYEHGDHNRRWDRHDVVQPVEGYVAPLALVKELRDRTGHPLLLCKRALQRYGGDLERAEESIPTKRAAA